MVMVLTLMRPSLVLSCMAVMPATRETNTSGTMSILIALRNSVPMGASTRASALNSMPVATPRARPMRICCHRGMRRRKPRVRELL
ncbi:hypothetical protein D3C78_1687800 [compost metagenome]